jgi:hypothetical protein
VSGGLAIREVQTRIFVASDRFSATVAYYRALIGGRCSLHFPFPERGLELASVTSPAASFLIIAGSEAALAPFRATALTVLVDDIERVAERLVPLGDPLDVVHQYGERGAAEGDAGAHRLPDAAQASRRARRRICRAHRGRRPFP